MMRGFCSLLIALAACGDGSTREDTGARVDSGFYALDAGGPDGTVSEADGGAPDATATDSEVVDLGPVDLGPTPDLGVADAGATDSGPPATCNEVRFSYFDAQATSVVVTGTFANWTPDVAQGARALTNDGFGTWTTVVTLDPGSYQYKFVVDGSRWLPDPNNPNRADDGFGSFNSVLEVCTGPVFQVLNHQTTGNGFTATIAYQGAGNVAQAAGSLDLQPLPANALTAANPLQISLSGLSDGIHDLRLNVGSDSILLKIYINETTDWRDTAMYFVMTDRFVNGSAANDAPLGGMNPLNDYMGGDFAGVTQRIEAGYFDELGINSLWISWPLDNTDQAMMGRYNVFNGCNLSGENMTRFSGYHGYWPSSGRNLESRFGTMAELQTLVNAAHRRGIRVLLDFTANHVHADHPYFSMHPEWFNQPPVMCRDGHWDSNLREECWFDSFLPDWRYTNPDARRAVIEDVVVLVKETGADGLRVDALKHMEDAFVTDLRRRTEQEFEHTGVDFYLVGETFTGDTGLINYYVNSSMMHGQFDFPSNQAIGQAFALDQVGLQGLHQWVRTNKASYGAASGWMSTFAGNHDIARFVSKASGELPCGWWAGADQSRAYTNLPSQPGNDTPYLRLGLAMTYVFSVPGIPLIYYGDEVGLAGAGDPDNRRMLPADNQLNQHQLALRNQIRRLGRLRAQNAVLRTGDWTDALWADDTLLVFGRTLGNTKAIIALNRGEARTVSVAVGGVGLNNGQLVNSQLGNGGNLTVSGGNLNLSVPRLSAEIWITP